MIVNKRLTVFIIMLSLFGLVAFSSVSHSNPTIPLNPTNEHPNANGTAIINGSNIAIGATGLKPNSVYTAWFVNTKPKKHETGAGQPPYMFKTDAEGKGSYFATLDSSPYGKWEMLMVVLHPNGNPKDMQGMVGALAAGLKN